MRLYDFILLHGDIEDYIDFGYSLNSNSSIEERVNYILERSKFQSLLNTLELLASLNTTNEVERSLLLASYSKTITLKSICIKFGWTLK